MLTVPALNPPAALYLGLDRHGVPSTWAPFPGQTHPTASWGPAPLDGLAAFVSGIRAETVTFAPGVSGWVLPPSFRGSDLPPLVVVLMPWGGWEDFPSVEVAVDNLKDQGVTDIEVVRHGRHRGG